MTRKRYPKLPPSLMRSVWIRRVLLTFVGTAVALLPVVRLGGDRPGVVVMLFLAGVALIAAAWSHPLSQFVFVYLATSLTAVFIAIDQLAVRFGVLVALAFIIIIGLRRHRSGVDPASLRLIDPATIMPHAEATGDVFISLGFTRVGAIGAKVAGKEVVASVMAGPDRRTYASFTDATISVMSVFADEHLLATVTSALAASPPWTLMNPEVGATPADLLASHERALELVAEAGARPLLLQPDEVPSIELRGELRHVAWVDANPFRIKPLEDQEPVWRRVGRYQEVEDWLAASVPPVELFEPQSEL